MIMTVFLSFLFLFAAIFFHELGHIVAFAENGVKVKILFSKGKIQVGEPADYQKLELNQKRLVYFNGIIWGLLPLVSAIFVEQMFSFLIPLYIFGCKKDIVNLWRTRNA